MNVFLVLNLAVVILVALIPMVPTSVFALRVSLVIQRKDVNHLAKESLVVLTHLARLRVTKRLVYVTLVILTIRIISHRVVLILMNVPLDLMDFAVKALFVLIQLVVINVNVHLVIREILSLSVSPVAWKIKIAH